MRTHRALRVVAVATMLVGLLAITTMFLPDPAVRAAKFKLDRGGDAKPAVLKVPKGFTVNIYASGLNYPRFMAVAPDGTLYVAELGAGRVVALSDDDGDGVADDASIVGDGFKSAHSLAFEADGSLLVAGTDTLHRLTLDDDGREIGREVVAQYPGSGSHSTRSVAVLPTGDLLVSVGSSCNVCWEEDEERATVLQIAPDGSDSRVLMHGLRNAVGVAVDPATGEGWVTNNGADYLGDNRPTETVYRLVDGADAGWPRCHSGSLVDPDVGSEPDPRTGLTGCDGVTAPDIEFQAHTAPLGMTFWRDHAVIAFHGSWNRSVPVGYEVLWIPWDDGPAGDAAPLLTGFHDAKARQETGRPVGVAAAPDGTLYVSDDTDGFIYRIAPA